MKKRSTVEQAQGTQLLDRAVAIMKLLGDAGEKGLRAVDMSERLNLKPPTAHRIIAALERHGLIEREAATKCYRLGLSLFTLGVGAADGMGLRRLCRPALLRIASETGDTVFLMARSGLNIVCVDRQEGTYILDSLTGHVGGQIPLGVGSASQAILAFLPEAEVQAILEANAALYGRFNGLSADEIRASLAMAREQGYALDQGRLVEGITAVAVPIVSQGRDIVAALAVNAISSRLPAERVAPLVERLKSEIAQVAAQLNPLEFATRGRVSSQAPA